MQQSSLFGKTQKETPRGEVATNAQLLIRAGFVDKLSAGIYTYLPLGLRVLKKIQNVIREEMEALGGQEILMPALHPKEAWEKTGRWIDPGTEVMYQFDGHGGPYGLGWTHEEIIAPLVKKYAQSYRDLPVSLFQIQDKFRNESRAKSGLLRGREFSMKDLYSFHASQEDLEAYYEKVMKGYDRIFERCGLTALTVQASGGSFSKYSHEYQVLTESGEDLVYSCVACDLHQNKEIVEKKSCPKCGKERTEHKSIEVGNIFQLGTRYTDAVQFTYTDEQGKIQPVFMGCYGIGPSRILGAVVEVHNDRQGIMWPETLAPYDVHIILAGKENEKVIKEAKKLTGKLEEKGMSILVDDRVEVSYGARMADADLIGIPKRIIMGEKNLQNSMVELSERKGGEMRAVSLDNIADTL